MSDDLVKRLRTPVKVMSVDEMADRIKELETKLAKALEALGEAIYWMDQYADEGIRRGLIKEYEELKGQNQ